MNEIGQVDDTFLFRPRDTKDDDDRYGTVGGGGDRRGSRGEDRAAPDPRVKMKIFCWPDVGEWVTIEELKS